MADPTLAAIDRFFDAADKVVDAADRVLNRGQRTIDIPKERERDRRVKREVIDATPVEKPTKKAAATAAAAGPATAPSTAVAVRPQFRIVEAIDQQTGATIYVVTDGRNARTECSTREFAAKILRALEKTP